MSVTEARTRAIDRVIHFYETHPINEEQILAKLQAAGVPLEGLREEELKHFDQDHFGGLEVVDLLAARAEIDASCHVLDVCTARPATWPTGWAAGSPGSTSPKAATRPRAASRGAPAWIIWSISNSATRSPCPSRRRASTS